MSWSFRSLFGFAALRSIESETFLQSSSFDLFQMAFVAFWALIPLFIEIFLLVFKTLSSSSLLLENLEQKVVGMLEVAPIELLSVIFLRDFVLCPHRSPFSEGL
jgi:hypothetical protein